MKVLQPEAELDYKSIKDTDHGLNLPAWCNVGQHFQNHGVSWQEYYRIVDVLFNEHDNSLLVKVEQPGGTYSDTWEYGYIAEHVAMRVLEPCTLPTLKTAYEWWNDGELINLGGFQTRLFGAYREADNGNRTRLEKAYPEWFSIKYDMNRSGSIKNEAAM